MLKLDFKLLNKNRKNYNTDIFKTSQISIFSYLSHCKIAPKTTKAIITLMSPGLRSAQALLPQTDKVFYGFL
jgi:hypothetical protein